LDVNNFGALCLQDLPDFSGLVNSQKDISGFGNKSLLASLLERKEIHLFYDQFFVDFSRIYLDNYIQQMKSQVLLVT